MVSLAVILKIILATAAFISAFLSVFRKTIDERGNLTRHGKISLACICITLAIGVTNEILNIQKDTRVAEEKIAAQNRELIIQSKLDQTLEDNKKSREESQKRVTDAQAARLRLEDIQRVMKNRLDEIDSRVSDPTVKKMVGELKLISKDSLMATGEKLSSVADVVSDIHFDIHSVKESVSSGKEDMTNIRNDISSLKTEIKTIRSEVSSVVTLVTPVLDAGEEILQEEKDSGND